MNKDQLAMLMIWRHMTTSCQQLQIFSLQIAVGISKVCANMKIIRSITRCAAPWSVRCTFKRLYFLFATANDLAWSKVLDLEVEKIDDQFCKLCLAFKEQSRFSKMLQNAQECSSVQSFE